MQSDQSRASRSIEAVFILPLHGQAQTVTSVADAIAFIEKYDEIGVKTPIVNYIIEIRYSNYSFSGLPSGGDYTVTLTKASLVPGTGTINKTDQLTIQRYSLGLTIIPPGCRLSAADVVINGTVNNTDVIAVQRLFLGFTSGIGSAGQYRFTPPSASYSNLTINQTDQNYAMYIVGDVAALFSNRPSGTSPDVPSSDERDFGRVQAVLLPEIGTDQSKTEFTVPVVTSTIDAENRLVGFQGDFTFDERVVRFEPEPVQKIGLTGGNWNVAGNVLPGAGPVRTLRVSAYSMDFTPLSGAGTLFQLKVARVSNGGRTAELVWAAPSNNLICIDADLNAQRPISARSEEH